MGIFKKFIILSLSLGLISCSSDDQGPTLGNEQTVPEITQVPGRILAIEAQEESFLISSDVVKDEIDEIIPDDTPFIISSDEGVLISKDDQSFSASAEVESLDGKFSFYVKVPTQVGTYRVEAKPKEYTSLGRFFIRVEPGKISSIGEVKSSRFEDLNQNGIKEDGEVYSFLADGQSTGFVIVGPIADSFGNTLDEGKVQITIDKGSIISENPASLSDGFAYIRVESDNVPGPAAVEAWAVNTTDQEIIDTRIQGQIDFVAAQLTIVESGDFGFVFLGEREELVLNLQNTGTSRVSNINYAISAPFILEDRGACNNKNYLLPGEICALTISFSAEVNQLFFGDLQIVGSPAASPGTTITHELRGFGAQAPEIRVESSSFDFGSINCGDTQVIDLVVENIGDFPAENLQVQNPQPHTNQTVRFFNLVVPPADPNPSPNPDAIIDCGTTLPGGRRCRVQVEFSPQALVSNEPLTAGLSVDGQNPIQITLRGAAHSGPPQGSPPVAFFTPGTENPISGISLSSGSEAQVRVGPVQDICGNQVANGTTLQGTVSKGSLIFDEVSTNSGIANFLWRGSDNVDDIGVQSITVFGGTATNSGILNFDGIKLELSGPTEAGQVLTVLPKTFTYTLANNGTVAAENLNLRTEGIEGEDVATLEALGNCEDLKLFPGESCDIIVEFNTGDFQTIPSNFVTNIRASTSGLGQIDQTVTVSGIADNPPVLSFSSTLYDLGEEVAGQGSPSTRVTLLNQSSADAFDLSLQLSEPFFISNSTCTDTLLAYSQCEFDVSLITTVSKTFNANLRAVSEFTEKATFLTGYIAPDKATGVIPMNLDTASVPANKTDEITITVGPIRDQYLNIVKTGTSVEIESSIGRLSLDDNQDGTALIVTNEQGLGTIKIKSKTFEEITSFTINSKVYDTDLTTVIAQGDVEAQFTGVILSFDETIINYGDVPVGNIELRTATIRNTGNETAQNLILSSSNSDFIISDVGTCAGALGGGATLAPGGDCEITIAFFPASNTLVNGFIQANSSGNGVLTDSVNVSGTGILPANLVAGVQEIFAPLEPGSSFSGSFTVENRGNESVDNFLVNVDNYSSDFVFNYSGCADLAALSSCTVSYVYDPSNVSSIQTTIRISGDGSTKSTVDSILFTSQPAQIQFQIVPFTLSVDECGEVKMGSTDFNNDPIVAATNINLNLAGSIGSFYSDLNCTNSITMITLLQGEVETSSFYFKSGVPGSSTVSISGSNLLVESTIQIFAPLTITPEYNNPIFVSNSAKDFTASGGVGPYSWQITGGLGITSGGASADSITFTANNTSSSGSYSIKVVDNIGNIKTFTGTKAPGMSVSPSEVSLISGASTTLVATGGSGSYNYSITDDQGLGSSINSSGVFTAGTNSTDFDISEEVTVSDSYGGFVIVPITIQGQKYKFTKMVSTGAVSYDDIFIYDKWVLVGDTAWSSWTGRVDIYEHDESLDANFSNEGDEVGSDTGGRFGFSIFQNYETLLIGAPYSDNTIGVDYFDTGFVHHYNVSNSPIGRTKTTPGVGNTPEDRTGDLFGYSVAAYSGGSTSLVVGSANSFDEMYISNTFGSFIAWSSSGVDSSSGLRTDIDVFEISNSDWMVAGQAGKFSTYKANYNVATPSPKITTNVSGSTELYVSIDETQIPVVLAVGDPTNKRILVYEFLNSGAVGSWTLKETITSSEDGFGYKVNFSDKYIVSCAGDKAKVFVSSNGTTNWQLDYEVQELGQDCGSTAISEDLMSIGFDNNGVSGNNTLYLYKIKK